MLQYLKYFISKKGVTYMDIKIWPIVAVLIVALMGAVAQYFFKVASSSVSTSILSWVLNYKFLIGAAIYGISTIIYLFALKHGDLSILYPVIATSYIWTALLAVRFLDESMSLMKWGGIVFIMIGVALIVK